MQGGLLWYFHTYVGSRHFFFFFFFLGGGGGGGGGLKLRISIFMRFSEKMMFLGAYEDFVDIFFRVIKNLDYNYGSFLCILGSFLKWRKFWGFAKI